MAVAAGRERLRRTGRWLGLPPRPQRADRGHRRRQPATHRPVALAALDTRAPAGPSDRCWCRARRPGPGAVRTGSARQPPGRCAGGGHPPQWPGGAAGTGRARRG
ncbi:hypothetical protein G6F23_013774 [Rhizopus arrhizus]|nr:hypothetical protein G6F23_013774 [Rhizopus arrhizus]